MPLLAVLAAVLVLVLGAVAYQRAHAASGPVMLDAEYDFGIVDKRNRGVAFDNPIYDSLDMIV